MKHAPILASVGVVLASAADAHAAPPRSPRTATGSGPDGIQILNGHRNLVKVPQTLRIASGGGTNGTSPAGVWTTCVEVGGPVADSVRRAPQADNQVQPLRASPADCTAVIGDIRANTRPLGVAAGYCHVWWEGACMAQVCATENPDKSPARDALFVDAALVADTLTRTVLEECVATKRESGVASDCADVEDEACGTYRFWLQDYNGEFDV